jgi:UDP-2,3-diacylglucosamine hydrolase
MIKTMLPSIELKADQKIYFASDFHLGAPNRAVSLERERKIIRWFEAIEGDAAHIFLMGDLFDYWYEYKYVIPKGFSRFHGKLAMLRDKGIPITIFTGNHDIWAFRYFTDEFGIPIYRDPQELRVNQSLFWIGHGDGLGKGDALYKILKRIFENKACQWLFSCLHPDLTFGFANAWSRHSRSNSLKNHTVEQFMGENEWIWGYCQEIEQKKHHDFYVFGHRHLPLDLPVGSRSRYLNLGEWLSQCQYAVFDGKALSLKVFAE